MEWHAHLAPVWPAVGVVVVEPSALGGGDAVPEAGDPVDEDEQREHEEEDAPHVGGALDLLVLGTRGIKGTLKRALLGSVSSYCLAFAPCPVIVVPGAVAHAAALAA